MNYKNSINPPNIMDFLLSLVTIHDIFVENIYHHMDCNL